MRILVALVSLLVSVPAQASVIYTYLGNPFVDIVDLPFPGGTFDTTMRVTGSFELASALPANMPLTDIGADVVAFSFSNGRNTLTESDPNLSTFFFMQTNAAGQITVWDLILLQTLTLTPLGDHDTGIITQNDTDGMLGISGIQDRGTLLMCDPLHVPRGLCIAFEDSATVDNTPGVWQSSAPGTPVPEPGLTGFMMLALGAGVLVARARAARESS